MNTVFEAISRWHRFGRLWCTPLIRELVQVLTTPAGLRRELRRASRRLARAQIDRTYALLTPSVKRMMPRFYRAANPRHFAGWDDALRALLAHTPALVL